MLTVTQVQDQIQTFSVEEKLHLIVYIANSVKGQAKADLPTASRAGFGALRDKITAVAPDFDQPLSDFAEYM